MEMPAETCQLERAMDGPKLLTASVDVLCYGVLILVNQILGDILQHELVCDGGHPGLHERSQIQQRLTVERKLIVNNLIGSFLVDTLS
jgi:hypothetical protein